MTGRPNPHWLSPGEWCHVILHRRVLPQRRDAGLVQRLTKGPILDWFTHVPITRPRRDTTLLLTERIGAVTLLLSSLEYLAESDDDLSAYVNRRMPARRDRAAGTRRRGLASRLADRRVTRGLQVTQAAAALVILAPTGRRTRFAANAVLAGTSGLLPARLRYGTDEADQASFVVQAAAAVARAAGEDRPAVVDAALWFIATYGTLSYTVSGWRTILHHPWRAGDALPGGLGPGTDGDQLAYRLVSRHPQVSRVLNAGLLAVQCLFPLAYAAGGRLAPVFVGSAAVFHTVTARVTGVNRAVPAFLAMHPTVLYTTGPGEIATRAGVVERRDDLFPAVLAAMTATAGAALWAAYRRRRRAVRHGGPGERRLATSAGNVLAVRRDGSDDPTTPVLFFESGLAGTLEQNAWLHRQLAPHFGVLSYHRAGYGSSTYRPGPHYRLDQAVQDLAELVADQAGSRPVILVGHSLGGYLIWRAAPVLATKLGGQLRALVLLDPAHPDQTSRSATQHRGAAQQGRMLAEMATLMRAGLGAVVALPRYVDALPPDVRELAAAQYRDPALWTTGLREWLAAHQLFASPNGRLAPVAVPALILTAESTARAEPIQLELHRGMADAAPRSQHHVVEGAEHDTLITEQVPAARVTALIINFLDRTAAPASTSQRTTTVRDGRRR